MPVGEPTIGGAGVVSSQDLGCEQKEFSQSPLLQCPGDRVSALAFAEGVTLHVRVRDIVATAGATRFQGHHRIRLITAELIEREPDLKGTEVDLFQNDAFGPDTEDLGRPVDLDFIELVLD